MGTKTKHSVIAVITLVVVGTITAAILSYLYRNHQGQIVANQHAYDLRQIKELLDKNSYDNDIFGDLLWVDQNDPDAQLLGTVERHYICRATQRGKPQAAILQVTAKNGYSGEIELIVGVNFDGSLAGVRVTRHRETPGLGDQIDHSRSEWIEQLRGRSLINPTPDQWRVRKDGGEFDQITGATVSSRAVTNAVKNALEYFAAHRHEIFAQSKQDSAGDT